MYGWSAVLAEAAAADASAPCGAAAAAVAVASMSEGGCGSATAALFASASTVAAASGGGRALSSASIAKLAARPSSPAAVVLFGADLGGSTVSPLAVSVGLAGTATTTALLNGGGATGNAVEYSALNPPVCAPPSNAPRCSAEAAPSARWAPRPPAVATVAAFSKATDLCEAGACNNAAAA